MYAFDENYCVDVFKRLLEVDSTTGQYEEIEELAAKITGELGFPVVRTHKGGLIADLGGEGNPIVVTAHLDDIGLMVRHINADGTLNVCPVGGLYPFYCVTENVRVHTADGRIYTGSVCRIPNSIHVTEEELRLAAPDFRKNVCVILDNDVKNAADVRALGIETGDYIALYPRFEMANGYLKSRFVDDKACAAVLFAAMKYIKDNGIRLNRKVYAYFAAYEEIGHGTSYLPEGVKDVLAIDIAPLGPDQNSDEKKVSIFAKDSRYPYHRGLLSELRAAAKEAGVDYVVDVFTPHYGSDGDTSIAAGHDVRHGAIGPGTLNSHGYERTHIAGLENTYELLIAYLLK
ncbi:MAG: M42 family metallopeptidase [Clostridiales bacterium]|nr:M42 family metallopeptidase [Clostridiales bacterium]